MEPAGLGIVRWRNLKGGLGGLRRAVDLSYAYSLDFLRSGSRELDLLFLSSGLLVWTRSDALLVELRSFVHRRLPACL